MRSTLVSTCSVLALLAAPGAAAASMAYIIDTNGTLTRFDPYSNAPAVLIGGGGRSQFMSGLTIDGSGQGWEFDWNGDLWRLDIQTGMSQPAGHLVQPQSGYFKDLAWDAVNNRVLAMHYASTAVTIGVVDTGAGSFTSLGTVAGLTPGHYTGLAVGPAGQIAIADDGGGYVWDVTQVPGGFTAVRRSMRATFGGGPLEGAEYDPTTGDLLACGPVNRVLADGSLQSLRPDVTGVDIAFVPVPAPAAPWVIAAAAGTLAVRRRSRR